MSCSNIKCDNVGDCRCYRVEGNLALPRCGIDENGVFIPCKNVCCSGGCSDIPIDHFTILKPLSEREPIGAKPIYNEKIRVLFIIAAVLTCITTCVQLILSRKRT